MRFLLTTKALSMETTWTSLPSSSLVRLPYPEWKTDNIFSVGLWFRAPLVILPTLATLYCSLGLPVSRGVVGKILHSSFLFFGLGVFLAPEMLNFNHLAQQKLWRTSHGGVFKDRSLAQSLHHSQFDEDYSVTIHEMRTKGQVYHPSEREEKTLENSVHPPPS